MNNKFNDSESSSMSGEQISCSDSCSESSYCGSSFSASASGGSVSGLSDGSDSIEGSNWNSTIKGSINKGSNSKRPKAKKCCKN